MKKGSVFGGTLLVAGTTIGGGMLALPVLTSLGGFLPSLVIYFLCWAFMASTGLLFLEVALWTGNESNIVTMASKTLGIFGKIFAWVLYLFLFYCLTLAYVVGCGDLVSQAFGEKISDGTGSLIFVAIFAPVIFMGTKFVSKLNVYLVAALAFFYFAFVALGFSFVRQELLTHVDWRLSLKALPIAFTAFAYQGIIPTLVSYLHYDYKKIRQVILIGSLIPLIAYIIWQWLILGIVPTFGSNSLEEALKNGDNAVYPLKNFIENPLVYPIGQCFAFFALLTSFLGVTLGLFDFLADGLQVKKTTVNKIFLCALIFIPPLCVAFIYPGLFLRALDFAGGFGCALLLGLLPILMVWRGRYHLGFKSPYSLGGGKAALILLLLFVLIELIIELLPKF
ncbi:MAG TPA: aromatic amino acid transport family protein [Parachlamydiaceae bacterium]|nr:aromatic amino acid transport family protein [Parachlamydiaceae bacterium]